MNRPFALSGSGVATFITDEANPIRANVSSSSTATHLGLCTTVARSIQPDPANPGRLLTSGTGTMTAANGDTVQLELNGGMELTPGSTTATDKASSASWAAQVDLPVSGYPLQRPHYSFRRQVEVHFDRQTFTIEVINYVEGAKATITPGGSQLRERGRLGTIRLTDNMPGWRNGSRCGLKILMPTSYIVLRNDTKQVFIDVSAVKVSLRPAWYH